MCARRSDSIEFWVCISGLRAKGIPKILAAALLRETMYATSTFTVNRGATSDPIRRTRSIMQGGTADPAVFNCALDFIATKFRNKCRNNGGGLRTGASVSSLQDFDNFHVWQLKSSLGLVANRTPISVIVNKARPATARTVSRIILTGADLNICSPLLKNPPD